MIRQAIFLISVTSLLVGCGADSDTSASSEGTVSSPAASQQSAAAPSTPMETTCESTGDADYLCGVVNGEDILRLDDSPWLLVSGMDGSLTGADIRGRIHLVNYRQRSVEVLFPGSSPSFKPDTDMFPDCPGPLDSVNFSSHGLALQASEKGPGIYRLYMTSHGAREAIEVFEVEAFLKPTISWVGCVPMPATSWTNSVAILDDGGFVATQFFDPSIHNIDNVFARENTGHVFEWHPGGQVDVIAGTQLSGPNGIALSEDDRSIFVAAFGTSELVVFDHNATPATSQRISLDIIPDNVRWTSEGKLYVAGNNTAEYCGEENCEPGWSVIEVDPATLETQRVGGMGEGSALHDASSALLVDDEIWVGTYSGDRLAILPR